MNARMNGGRGRTYRTAMLAAGMMGVATGAVIAQPERPGATNPLEQFYGPPPYEPVLRDDEVVVFAGDTGGAQRYLSLYRANGSDNMLIERGGAGDGAVVSAATGRLIGSPLDQAVVIRKITDSQRRGEVLDLYGSDPRRVIARWDMGVASNPGDPDSDVAVVVTDLDGVVTNGHRHDEIVVARKVIQPGVGASVRLAVWTLAGLTQLDYDNPPEPTLLVSTVINVQLPTSDGSVQRLGRLTNGEASAIKLRAMEVPIGGVMTPCVALAHVSSNVTDPRLLLGVFTLDGIAAGQPANLGQIADTDSHYALVPTVTARRTGGWDIVTGKFTSRTDEDGFDVGTNLAVAIQGGSGDGRVLLRTYYWLYSRLARAACSPDGPCSGDDTYGGFPGSPTLLEGADVAMSAFPRTFIPGQEHMDGFALYAETTRGPIVQCYVGDTVPSALVATRLAWPASLSGRPTLSGTSVTTGTALAGKVIRSRAAVDLTSQNYPVVVIAPDSNGDGVIDNFDNFPVVLMRASGSGQYFEGSVEKFYIRHLVSADPLQLQAATVPRTVEAMVLGDLDADSAYYSFTSKQTGLTFYIGPGERVSFDDVEMPELMIQEPPKHVDFLRTGEFSFSPQVVNVSKSAGFSAGYRRVGASGLGHGGSLKTSSTLSEKTGWSIGGSVGLETEMASGSISGGYEDTKTELQNEVETAIGMATSTVTFDQSFRASSDDIVQYTDTRFDLWRFPVYGLTAPVGTPDNVIPDNPFLQLLLPATDVGVGTQSDGTSARQYQPSHINGNVLSYPWYTESSDNLPYDAAIADSQPFIIYEGPNEDPFDRPIWAENEYGVRVPMPSPGITLTYDHLVAGQHEVGFERSVSEVEGWNVKGEVSVKVPVAEGVTMPVGVTGGYEQSTTSGDTWANMTTKTRTSQTTQSVNILTPEALGAIDSERNYFFYPAFYFEKSGAVRLNFHVRLDPGADFWITHYGRPDPALNLPGRMACAASTGTLDQCSLNTGSGRGEMKGLVLEDDFGVERVFSPDAGGAPTALSGEVLKLRARVFNLSAGTVPPPPGAPDPVARNVAVRFDVAEIAPTGVEIGPRVPIGTKTIAAIQPRESAWTPDLLWDTLDYGVCGGSGPDRRYRIFVVVDPNNTIADETHELFDRDATPLRSTVTGLPVDFAYDAASGSTRFLERGQNNLGWGDVTIGAWQSGPGCDPTPLSGNVSLPAGSLAVASVNNGVLRPFQNDSAVVIRNDALRLRVAINVGAPGTAYGPRTVVVYRGVPLADGSNIVGQTAIADPAGFGARNVEFDWMGALPPVGEHTLYARASDSDGVGGDNQDVLTLLVVPGAQEIMYVDSNAGGGTQDGRSWANAFLALDDALGVVAKVDANITVRVAGGTGPANPRVYLPNRMDDPGDTRTASFHLPGRVTVEGGYRGSFAPPGQQDVRDPAVYPVVLSGDLEGDDTPYNHRGDNVFNVCRVDGGQGVTLDGVTIKGGSARSWGGGAVLSTGGGVTLRNVVFEDNVGEQAPVTAVGGTLAIEGCRFGTALGRLWSNVSINDASCVMFSGGAVGSVTDTLFINNQAEFGRGTVVASGLGTAVTVDRARFELNIAGGDGPGIVVLGQAGVNVTNSLLVNQESEGRGGAAACIDGTLTLAGCTISGNDAAVSGAGVFAGPTAAVRVTSSVLWGNAPAAAGQVAGPASVTDSIVQGGFAGSGNIDADPMFADALGGDYSLRAGSPAIDSGDSTGFGAGVTLDLAGRARVADDAGAPNPAMCGYSPAPIAGGALVFDGVDSTVFLGNPTALNFGSTFTLEAWVRPTTTSPGAMQVTIGRGIDGNGARLGMYIANGAYGFMMVSPPSINLVMESSQLVAGDVGQWVHLAVVRNATTVLMYRNGVAVAGAGTVGGPASIASPWTIGAIGSVGSWFNGGIDEVRMWAVARTASQIQAADDQVIPGDSSGLIGYYRFEELSGPTATDSGLMFGQQNGTLVGGPVRVRVASGACAPVDMGAFEFQGASCPSDWNHDGVVNSTDVSDFINAWFSDQGAGTLVADWNHDGVSNSTDVSDFINAWFSDQAGGC